MDRVIPTDVELVADIWAGRRPAETQLYERFAQRVFYLALRCLKRREDAEDARAETFLRVLQALRGAKLRSPEALPAFVLETVRNVIRERLRRASRSRQIDPHDSCQAAALIVDPPAFDPYAQRALEHTLREMAPRDRAFLRMYYYEDLTREEISRRLGIKEERLRLIKSRALKRFREEFARLSAC